MTGATPTTDELELALKVATRIDDAGYRMEHSGKARNIRLQGLRNIILDELMQFARQQPEREIQTEIDW